MRFFRPESWREALEIQAEHPDARPISGGTDVMVDLNFDRSRPDAMVDLTRVPELRGWREEGGWLNIGANVTYSRIIAELGDRLSGLAMASRTVGSPQIRNRGTVGGNLATASPAGDGLPPLYASNAEVEVASVDGSRRMPVAEFVTGPKRNGLRPGELISSFRIPKAAGPQQYAKVGTRNAMVIAVCSFGLDLRPEKKIIGACVGSAAPTPVRATEAEDFIRGVLEERGLWESRSAIGGSALRRFGELAAGACRPIGDVRGTSAYRTHAVAVLARRTLGWAWDEYRRVA